MYTLVYEWDAREKERERTPHPIAWKTHFLLMNFSLLKFCEEDTSLKGDY